MSIKNTAPEEPELVPGEVATDSVNFSGKLDTGEVITAVSTPTVAPSGLTVTSATISTEELIISNMSVPVGQAVQFTVSGGTPGVKYTITVTVTTSRNQTRKGHCIVKVEA